MIPVFDGHNDVLLRLWSGGDGAMDGFRDGSDGHIDAQRGRAGGFAGGFFVMFVPGAGEMSMADLLKPAYDLPLPDMVP